MVLQGQTSHLPPNRPLKKSDRAFRIQDRKLPPGWAVVEFICATVLEAPLELTVLEVFAVADGLEVGKAVVTTVYWAVQ